MFGSASTTTALSNQDQQTAQRIAEAAKERLAIDLRDVQVQAGTQLLGRTVVEMQTGEGKTLTTVLAAAILASRQRRRQGNVLVATANDYLAERDAQWMSPLYADLGLEVGFVRDDAGDDARAAAYQCDITYGTIRQFAFDYLRSRLADRTHSGAANDRQPFRFDALIVDEADSVLIDEARTPLIITSPIREVDESAAACYRWAAEIAAGFRIDDDFVHLDENGAVALTEQGRGRAVRAIMPPAMASLSTTQILHRLEQAIWVRQTIHRDWHYVVNDGRIAIVDEYTGRKQQQRSFGGGIQQSIEAREQLELTPESEIVATISVQDFVVRFDHVCGLTATAWEDRRELETVYDLRVLRLPTHMPSRRVERPPCVCRSQDEKWQAILDQTRRMTGSGRAVLIGTRTIEQSEQLSRRFAEGDVDHVVLNARNVAEEADVVARAGEPGRVTIATNMAGRGTDIRLHPEVAQAGGLHVIVSEPHAAARIDRQLVGRCGRQGDPGSAQLFVCPEDQIFLQAWGPQRAQRLCDSAGSARDRWLLGKLRQAQKRVAHDHRLGRARLTAHQSRLAAAMQTLGLDPNLNPLQQSGG